MAEHSCCDWYQVKHKPLHISCCTYSINSHIELGRILESKQQIVIQGWYMSEIEREQTPNLLRLYNLFTVTALPISISWSDKYTQTNIHRRVYTDEFTQTSILRQVYTDEYTQTQTSLHRRVYTDKYTQTSIHRQVYTDESTQTSIHRQVYTDKCTQTIIHNEHTQTRIHRRDNPRRWGKQATALLAIEQKHHTFLGISELW